MGKMGDVIYSLPAIRELGGGILYLPENTPDQVSGMYGNMKRLLELQPYIHEVREYPSGLRYKELAPAIRIDYDLDIARDQPGKGVVHIVKRYLDAFGIKIDSWKEPWLHVSDKRPISDDYVLINYTGRHIVNERMPSRPFDWAKLIDTITQKIFFVGTLDEYLAFSEGLNRKIHFKQTTDALDLAQVVKGATAIYCNQSLVLTLAQGLGVRYYLFPKPFKTNCIMNTPIENILK